MTKKHDPQRTLHRVRFQSLIAEWRDEVGERSYRTTIAAALGITPDAVGKLYRGDRGPDASTIAAAKRAKGISDEFFDNPALGDRPSYRDHLRAAERGARARAAAGGLTHPGFEAYIEREAEEGRPIAEAHAAVLRAARLPGGEHAATVELAEQIAIALRKADRLQSAIAPPPARSSTRRKAAS